MDIFFNYPLMASIMGNLIAQVAKIPLYYMVHKKWQWGLILSTGGMPSSHSSTVTALATSVGLSHGFSSTYFAIAMVVALIVMHDAAGVRRHAGYHAALLNKLVEDFQVLLTEVKSLHIKEKEEKREKLKELLGHKPTEVLGGALVGIAVAIFMKRLF